MYELYERFGTPLKDWGIRINYGIKTGCNEAYIIDSEKRERILAGCKDKGERDRTDKLIRPILRGRDIKRNGYNWPGLYVILAYFDFHKDINLYPTIYNHLKQYEAALRKRGQVRYTSSGKPRAGADYPGQHHWLELDNNPRKEYMDDFSKQRFIWTAVNSEYRFTVLEDTIYYNNSIFHGVCDVSYGIASFMNSDALRCYLKLLSSEGYQYGGKEMIGAIPIPANIKNHCYTNEEVNTYYGFSNDEIKAISSSVNSK